MNSQTYLAETAQDEVCPVCKLDTYMNPSMRFLINPECYHRMCESCVDRIFSQGPAHCPYPNCDHTLRKSKFRRPTFSDVAVEREVDIRRRVASVFNKRPDEFESLQEYNDYLEEVETIIFNLVNNVEFSATTQKIETYENENKSSIRMNTILQSQESEKVHMIKKLEEDQRRAQRASALQETLAEEEMKKEAERQLINDLASAKTGDAEEVVRKVSESVQRGIELKRRNRGQQNQDITPSLESTALSMLKQRPKRSVTEVEEYDPARRLREEEFSNELYFVRKEYYDPFLDKIASSKTAQAAGYTVANAYEQALFDAFLGLGCLIDDEKNKKKL
ncbi:CDK-activating kinase assembly factor MAT1-domain-containing protein [Lipomyces oligophaga]|uniref:CDK-activating kinase assembly factor MAT1-domain-containing protein n=1 Tax=Lipomyces oligophaga TaxID=45792 RepID=UPI0034CFCB66